MNNWRLKQDRRDGNGHPQRKFLAVVLGGFLVAGLLFEDAPAQQQASPSAAPGSPASVQPSPTEVNTAPAASDNAGRDQAVIQHLNAVLRYYHDAQAPIQKVGEPSDLIYRDQAAALAGQMGGFAFQSAKAEAALVARPAPSATTDSQTAAQRLQATRDGVTQRIAALKTQDEQLQKQLDTARTRDIPALQQQRQQIQGELELQTAMSDALGKITGMSGLVNDTGFASQVAQLERSAPGLADGKAATVTPTLESLSAARSAGVTSQALVLFQLLNARQSIEALIQQASALHQEAAELRNPLVDSLKQTLAQGEVLSQKAAATNAAGTDAAATDRKLPAQPTAAVDAATLAATRKSFDSLTATFKGISSAAVPLSQELMAIEQSQASLQAWLRAVNEEYASILRSLLLRVLGIALALVAIFIVGEIWRRATTKYVRDIRRRRQLLVIRRLGIGFLSGLVLIFGLVTQFSSLATFAGFITAGIAVGLQTILLSVAAYFFIIGRYGVKVGDRITIAGVTGDVAEVGLVRFYMMELAGSGTDLYPSGRVAVFSNAVLFQAGTPLYKQMPGTEYLWHEMTVKLAPDADYRPAVAAMLKAVEGVYDGYRPQIERQHHALESWMDTSLDAPTIQSSLQLVDGGVQFWARFPVLIKQTNEIDHKMSQALLETIASDPKIKEAVGAPPVIKAAVKG